MLIYWPLLSILPVIILSLGGYYVVIYQPLLGISSVIRYFSMILQWNWTSQICLHTSMPLCLMVDGPVNKISLSKRCLPRFPIPHSTDTDIITRKDEVLKLNWKNIISKLENLFKLLKPILLLAPYQTAKRAQSRLTYRR